MKIVKIFPKNLWKIASNEIPYNSDRYQTIGQIRVNPLLSLDESTESTE